MNYNVSHILFSFPFSHHGCKKEDRQKGSTQEEDREEDREEGSSEEDCQEDDHEEEAGCKEGCSEEGRQEDREEGCPQEEGSQEAGCQEDGTPHNQEEIRLLFSESGARKGAVFCTSNDTRTTDFRCAFRSCFLRYGRTVLRFVHR